MGVMPYVVKYSYSYQQDIPGNQVQSLGHQTLSLPLHHLEDENLPGDRRDTWSIAQAPAPSPVTVEPSTANPAATIPTKHQPQG